LRHDELGGVHTLAVNLSGQAVSDPAFLQEVSAIVRSTRFDARKLCLELTETAAITNMSDAKAFVDAMRDIGLRFALDDFGVGASGFGYLKTLRVDYLKIDGQFIRDLQGDMIDRASVQCFCDVAAAVGTRTIAEFVEDDVTAALLREIGVDYGQGYFYHQPEPIDAVLAAFGGPGGAGASGMGQSSP
jgi:EAL domain-containing protein (putative c-di-GMP-specific phosphodiesterase class I)